MRRFDHLDSAAGPPNRVTTRSVVGAYALIAAALFCMWAVSYPSIAVFVVSGAALGTFGTITIIGIAIRVNGPRLCFPRVGVCLERQA